MPQVLLAAVVPLMPITKCMRTPMIGPRVNKNNICAGGFGTDACNVIKFFIINSLTFYR